MSKKSCLAVCTQSMISLRFFTMMNSARIPNSITALRTTFSSLSQRWLPPPGILMILFILLVLLPPPLPDPGWPEQLNDRKHSGHLYSLSRCLRPVEPSDAGRDIAWRRPRCASRWHTQASPSPSARRFLRRVGWLICRNNELIGE